MSVSNAAVIDIGAIEPNIPEIPRPASNSVLIPAQRYSSDEWLKSLLSLPKSFILRRISFHLVANTFFAALVYTAYVIWPETVKALLKGMIPAPGPHLMLSGALGFLLVFRTNTAYDRYWEGQRLWGFLYSRTRDLARLAHRAMPGKDREHFLQLVAATPPILLHHLRTGWLQNGKSPEGYNLDLESLLQQLLPKQDHSALLHSANR
jgi:predicted membrane chloride channel (bestrophin family)